MFSYNVGDKVMVESYENICAKGKMDETDFIWFKGHNVPFSPPMIDFCNKVFIISGTDIRTYMDRLPIPIYRFEGVEHRAFTEEMFKKIKKQKFDFKELVIEML